MALADMQRVRDAFAICTPDEQATLMVELTGENAERFLETHRNRLSEERVTMLRELEANAASLKKVGLSEAEIAKVKP